MTTFATNKTVLLPMVLLQVIPLLEPEGLVVPVVMVEMVELMGKLAARVQREVLLEAGEPVERRGRLVLPWENYHQ